MTCVYETITTSCKEQKLSFLKFWLGIRWSKIISYILKTARELGPGGFTEELRYWLSERDTGALLLTTNTAFERFVKLPLGIAETKRFLHQGLFLSDFSSSLSLRSSVCRKSLMLYLIYLELGSTINYYEKDFSEIQKTLLFALKAKWFLAILLGHFWNKEICSFRVKTGSDDQLRI